MPELLIIGAGLTGLSCAYHSQKPCLVLEKNEAPGGLCGSVREDGYTFDHSGHFMHVHSDETKEFVRALMKGNLATISRNSWIRTHGVFVPYPFQVHLHNLPEKIKKECLDGFLRTHQTHRTDRTGSQISQPKADPLSFYEWSLATFGPGITKYFMKPYNEKLWTVSSKLLTADWVAPFVPRPSKAEVTAGASSEKTGKFGYNASFFYPKKGGSQSFVDALGSTLGNVRCSMNVVRIDFRRKRVETSAGTRVLYERLVSTQPLPDLLDSMAGLPADVAAAKEKLDWNSVTCLNLGVKKAHPRAQTAGGKHWIYFPEDKFVFYRTGIYSNIAHSMAPAGRSSFYVEISHRPGKDVRSNATLKQVLEGMLASGILLPEDKPEVVNWLPIPCAYVIYDKDRTAALAVIQRFLKKNHIHSIGRYGAWKYSFMEESLIDGKKTAEMVGK